MKAAVLCGRESIEVRELDEAALQPGEVRIRIRAALTCGTDLKVFKRGYHARMIVPPAVFGHELAGEISETGPGALEWRVGDRVVAANSAPCGGCFYCRHQQENLCDDLLFLNGAYAQSIVVPARLVQKNLLRLKPETPFTSAALVEPLACVVLGMEDCRLKGGERVLIIGSGPIGLMFVRLASHAGCDVTLAGRGASRLEAAKKLGAREIIEVGRNDGLRDVVSGPAGLGFDAVIEAVGKTETWEAAVGFARKGGTVNFFGGCPAGSTVSLPAPLIHYSALKLLASFHHTPRTIRRSLELIESGVIQAAGFVDGDCPLSELPALFQSMAAGNHAVKTLIRVEE